MHPIQLNTMTIGSGAPWVLIAGPCVIESEKQARDVAVRLKEITTALDIPLIFKASYDKANRTSVDAFRGPGLREGLRILGAIKKDLGLPVLSDVHRFEEIAPAAEVLDVLQVPAFLCRQTDFVAEIARHAKIINIKKGQFLAPSDVSHIVRKAEQVGNTRILLTERGTSFGYHNLVVDFRGIVLMRRLGYPVVFDGTHSVQLPGGMGKASGGERSMVPALCRAAVAVGVDGLFLEVHPCPDEALCDGPNSLALDQLPELLGLLKRIDPVIKKQPSAETSSDKE